MATQLVRNMQVFTTGITLVQFVQPLVDLAPGILLRVRVAHQGQRVAVPVVPGQLVDQGSPCPVRLIVEPGMVGSQIGPRIEHVRGDPVQLGDMTREPGHFAMIEDQQSVRKLLQRRDRPLDFRVPALARAVHVKVEAVAVRGPRFDLRQVHALRREHF